jgi:hypothetical protein
MIFELGSLSNFQLQPLLGGHDYNYDYTTNSHVEHNWPCLTNYKNKIKIGTYS